MMSHASLCFVLLDGRRLSAGRTKGAEVRSRRIESSGGCLSFLFCQFTPATPLAGAGGVLFLFFSGLLFLAKER